MITIALALISRSQARCKKEGEKSNIAEREFALFSVTLEARFQSPKPLGSGKS
jgi:hypothetical protein